VSECVCVLGHDAALQGLDLTHATTHTHGGVMDTRIHTCAKDKGKRVYLYVCVCVCVLGHDATLQGLNLPPHRRTEA
jgi:hypothetical protein